MYANVHLRSCARLRRTSATPNRVGEPGRMCVRVLLRGRLGQHHQQRNQKGRVGGGLFIRLILRNIPPCMTTIKSEAQRQLELSFSYHVFQKYPHIFAVFRSGLWRLCKEDLFL